MARVGEDRIGQAALLAHLLEQPRRGRAAENGVEDAQRKAPVVGARDPAAAHAEVVLLGVLLVEEPARLEAVRRLDLAVLAGCHVALRGLDERDEPVGAEELERAKENVKGRTALSLESTLTRMNRLGGSILMDVPLLSLDEMVAAIDAVTAEDVQELARDLFAPDRMSAAGVGADEDAFKRALDAVNPELAAAA